MMIAAASGLGTAVQYFRDHGCSLNDVCNTTWIGPLPPPDPESADSKDGLDGSSSANVSDLEGKSALHMLAANTLASVGSASSEMSPSAAQTEAMIKFCLEQGIDPTLRDGFVLFMRVCCALLFPRYVEFFFCFFFCFFLNTRKQTLE
jgi:hypothetical protein